MKTFIASCVCVIVASLGGQSVRADAQPAYLVAAVADSNRPDVDRARDAGRKPTEVLAFAGIKPGDKMADFIPGRGYFTRIFCKAVGDAGRVYAISVPFKRAAASSSSAPAATTTATSSSSSSVSAAAASCGNVTNIMLEPSMVAAPELYSRSDDPGAVYEYRKQRPAAENFAAPEPLDLIWTSENYHDLHNPGFGSPDIVVVNKALFAALKPGGILIVEDHAAAAGSGIRDTNTLHRIDPEQVKKEVTAAGFVYVGESRVLRNPDDAHDTKAHDMHDQTDRFLFKFRRP